MTSLWANLCGAEAYGRGQLLNNGGSPVSGLPSYLMQETKKLHDLPDIAKNVR